MLASEEAGLDTASLRDLRSVTDLALRATKATLQAIGRSMSSLIVLKCHLWLTMMEMKEADKVPFLEAPVRQPVWTSFAERFTEAQKSSQAMRYFLPKRTSSSAASSHPRPVWLTPLGPESWFCVVPNHSTAWLDWFPYSVKLDAVRVKYRKGAYSVTIVTSVPWDMGMSTAFLAVLWAARLSCFIRRNLRCGGRAADYIARCPSYFGKIGGKIGKQKLFFPYRVELDAVLIPISQGTEVTTVTENVFVKPISIIFTVFFCKNDNNNKKQLTVQAWSQRRMIKHAKC